MTTLSHTEQERLIAAAEHVVAECRAGRRTGEAIDRLHATLVDVQAARESRRVLLEAATLRAALRDPEHLIEPIGAARARSFAAFEECRNCGARVPPEYFETDACLSSSDQRHKR